MTVAIELLMLWQQRRLKVFGIGRVHIVRTGAGCPSF
ncbi:MAG TPA: hypothetical protein DEB17_04005 [Chlorobaculum sp.]|uniref:Uncharacterized protein n=1 Tax=Chlorobaculum tepidum (strain ATCC 49652 / DSM 12025 / NBRC 103806 / TLS) TaxID=194439 RepID=Q8KE06_CHLTE|nr:hypothetical protein CT0888 [Chlorobaculum tepidum TLS]HBU23150.1 hypothetical protein [Chlorobaculum sp.]